MQLQLSSDRRGNLTARQAGGLFYRLIIGGPLFLMGVFCLMGMVQAPMAAMSQGGSLANAIVSAIAMTVFTVLLLPLAWWILFSRHWLVLDMDSHEVVQVSDWRLGRKEKRTPLNSFKAIRMALEYLDSTRSGKSRARVLQIRLLARPQADTPSISVGWFEQNQRAQAIAAAEEISQFTGLPLERRSTDEISLSPFDEELENEDLDDEEEEAAEDGSESQHTRDTNRQTP